MNPGGQPPAFVVTFRPGLLDRLRRWAAVAQRFRAGAAFLSVLREAERDLRTRPQEWGDPLYSLRQLSLTVYGRYAPPLLLRYAVHDTQPVVFVQDVAFVPSALFGG